jgi:hypothetical protein
MDLKTKISLKAKLHFNSGCDEEAFFEWVDKIGCVSEKWFLGSEHFFILNTNQIADYNLREFIALFYRYSIDMKQLAQFLSNKNKSWFFDNKKTYWHDKVFWNNTESK